MTLDQGWMKKQMSLAAAETKKWPDWMKQEAGIHQHDKHTAKQSSSNGAAPQTKDSSTDKS